MSAPSKTELFLRNHPVSSYAQKIRIALREKGLEFDFATPQALGSGAANPSLSAQNPRLEVPTLVDGDFAVFDSTIILQYLEDAYPDSPLLPKDAKERVRVRHVEEICDTTYEAINWAYGEVNVFGRAEGEEKEKLMAEMKRQTIEIQTWLGSQLGDRPYFNGETFGYGESAGRESVKTTFGEFEEGLKAFKAMGGAFAKGRGMRREYRDYRLEFMVKSGGLGVVKRGIEEDTVRFGWPEGGASKG
ncbi:hypothetical protein B0A48_08950 [Cryoendolithus antarcticus]|uniref:GST N-terminal domain-containing protein n=1 Tax=Cryoendolithus antarcticus TaxID=1507870 RepID=A0A1V8T533_9PEZI|nr:hypothetical protein B0A48_08950 [Cryoendolithus antarcticus]